VEGTATAVFSQYQTIRGGLRAFSRKNRRSQADAETVGFHLNMAFHENDLEDPSLKPTQPERIGHGSSLRSDTPYGS
jgi:hypothetical protein